MPQKKIRKSKTIGLPIYNYFVLGLDSYGLKGWAMSNDLDDAIKMAKEYSEGFVLKAEVVRV